MRILLVNIFLLSSLNVFAMDDKSMQELFKKYDLVMDGSKTNLIDEVFTEKFVKSSGGKAELIEKIKDLNAPSTNKSMQLKRTSQMTWKKGHKGEVFLAKLKDTLQGPNKAKPVTEEAEFIVVKENGKLKIDGTMSDAE